MCNECGDEYEDDLLGMFEPYDDILMFSKGGRIERGFILQVTSRGLAWGRTHKSTRTGPNDEDVVHEELKRPILTFTRFGLIDRLESTADLDEEDALHVFADLLAEVVDAGDFAAITEAASDDDA